MKIMKSFVRITAIANKEWLQIRRDTRSLTLALIAPVILILLFGYALSVDVTHVPVAIYDQDRSALSRSFLERFSHTEYLNIYTYVHTYKKLDDLIDRGEIAMGLVIPLKFEKNFKAGKQSIVQLLVDGSDSTTATVAMGYITSIISEYNIDIMMQSLQKIGIADTELPLRIKSRVWYNPELESKNFIIPGLIVMILAIISALVASLAVSREWERGTMETLVTTPVRGHEIILGKMVPYIFIGLFDVVVTVSIGHFVFDMPLKGSFVELYLVALLFLIGTSGLGIMISSVTRVQVLSVQAAMVVTYLPSFILSGFIFPIQNMPYLIQGITYLVPARYLIILMRGIALKGVSSLLLWIQILFLFLFALLVIVVGIKKISLTLPETS
jgi:ABC-2 type transport system permease protein